ncbi:hypothetical protein [Priestia aryabhattai]|uniref:hypothetical protein n=1 Tax=Priestia aryabhattai TaxID=412384 RepID=UPI00203D92A5|nr:hypothetical protein [Priestia aryabhattai]MCM3255576.1 hypothetical protein [Priestia aryabhattai]
MMIVMIRETHAVSPFRYALLDLMKAPGNELILAYGYLTDCITDDTDKTRLGYDFKRALNHSNMQNCTIYLIAGSFDYILKPATGSHQANFEKAYNKLKSYIKRNHPTITVAPISHVNKITANKIWHGKIALKKEKDVNAQIGTVSAALVGSSNLSANATQNSKVTKAVQSNCDIYLWDGNIHKSIFTSKGSSQDTKGISDILPLPLTINNSNQSLSNPLGMTFPARPLVPLKDIFEHLYSKVQIYC